MDRQEFFNRALFGVRAQGRKASGEDDRCAYRIIIDGKMCKCGIGHNIPDELYDPDWDVNNIRIKGLLSYKSPFPDVAYYSEDANFLVNLQQAHDRAHQDRFFPEFESYMEALATKYDLVYIGEPK